ncbi:hypothetical protein ES703_44044 [subsurface metagenome]
MKVPSGLRIDSPAWPLLQALISYWGITDNNGNAAGTTIRCGDLALEPSYANHALKILSGPAAGQTRDTTTHPAGTDTVTVANAFSNVAGVPQQITAGILFVILSKTPTIAEVAALVEMVETNQYYDRIFYDEATGIAGTGWPVGTPQVPSDVIADVITMCTARNLRTISIRGALTLGATMENYNFIGSLHQEAAHAIDLNGQDVDGSHIYGIGVTGAQGGTGFLSLEKVTVNALTLFAGRMRNCDFYTSTSSFRDASYINLIDCQSITGVVTLVVQAPTRASIKNWRGNLILTLQDGGLCNVRGFKGTLEIDEMTAGTLNVYANGADITINADCTGGTINIYGNAGVTDNSVGATVNDYTLDVRMGRQLFTMDFWSAGLEEVQIGDGVAGATVALPDLTVADLPAGATIVRAIVMFKFRMIENTNAAINQLNGATVALTSQVIQIRSDAPTAYVDAINFVDDFFELGATTRESGDVIVGTEDVAATVDENDTYNLRWLLARADLDFINFNDCQVGLRIWYSV